MPRIALPGPVSLGAVLGHLQRGRSDPCMRLWDRGCWRATRTPHGPATIAVTVDGAAADVQAWGPGASWATDHVADLLGAADGTVEEFRPPAGLVRDLLHDAGGAPAVRIGRTDAVAEALVPTVLEQRVTGPGARRSWRWLIHRYGEPAPGPGREGQRGPLDGLRLPPAPEVLAAVPSWTFHRAGIERKRAETITGAMRRAARLEEASTMALPDAHRRLLAFPGIGPWSANEIALVALGDADAVSVGDFHLKNLVSYALAGESRGTDERMLELLEPYAGHRARVVRLIERSGIGAPRYGPRVAVPAIASL